MGCRIYVSHKHQPPLRDQDLRYCVSFAAQAYEGTELRDRQQIHKIVPQSSDKITQVQGGNRFH